MASGFTKSDPIYGTVDLDDEYIKKLSYTLQDNISKNPKLYYKIYMNKKFALKYEILIIFKKYIFIA